MPASFTRKILCSCCCKVVLVSYRCAKECQCNGCEEGVVEKYKQELLFCVADVEMTSMYSFRMKDPLLLWGVGGYIGSK